MHATDLDYNWKQAASQESVDYQAVESTFMTQAYGFVANKAKVLFRDPFRLGFEIVHRNEKATKMVGIFAFRCDGALMFAPVFFVDGEIKGADMLYRSDVKRFVPLSDDWCSFLVRGANEATGKAQRRGSNRRQSDSNMHRLAYPQQTKYAAEISFKKIQESADDETKELLGEKWASEMSAARDTFVKGARDGSIWKELLAHCADDAPIANILPRALRDGGPDALTKLAGLIEGSDLAARFVAENYTKDDLLIDPDWCVKRAAAVEAAKDPLEPYRNSVVLVRELGLAKCAADRKKITNHGYVLEDYRELGAVNAVTDTIEDPTVHQIATPGVVSVMDTDGGSFDALLCVTDYDWLTTSNGDGGSWLTSDDDNGRALLTLGGKGGAEYLRFRGRHSAQVIGNLKDDTSCLESCCSKPSSAKAGKVYVLFHAESLRASTPFVVVGREGKTIQITGLYGNRMVDLTFRADAAETDPNRGFVNGDFSIIEVKTERDDDDHTTVWTKSLMAPSQLDAWMRTGGGVTHSKDITVTKEPSGLFTISAKGSDGFHKVARSLDRMHAHLSLAGDFEMRVSAAGEVLDCVEDTGVTRFRLFDTVKKAYMTQMMPEQEWITGYDPVLNARVTSPQTQHLGTFTPERPQQHHRIGDRYMGEAPQAHYDPEEDGLPPDALLGQSPEALAELSQKYDMPHIFDHQVIGSLAGNTYDTIGQVRQYIPDLETGVDRYARILFLLRYRPADFEEAYGKDELMEMEQELTSLFAMSGESLLRMLKRFDTDKFSPQSDS